MALYALYAFICCYHELGKLAQFFNKSIYSFRIYPYKYGFMTMNQAK